MHTGLAAKSIPSADLGSASVRRNTPGGKPQAGVTAWPTRVPTKRTDRFERNFDATSSRSELYGIGQQVPQQLLQTVGVA